MQSQSHILTNMLEEFFFDQGADAQEFIINSRARRNLPPTSSLYDVVSSIAESGINRAGIIAGAFAWDKSPQGRAPWAILHAEWCKFIMLPKHIHSKFDF